MKKQILPLVCLLVCCAAAFAQSVTLTFTAKDAANNYVQLNRVVITNLTKSWQETIYWPDMTLTMQNGTGIADVETCHGASLQLSQNNPNPFTGTTEVSLTVAEDDEVMVDIADVNGKIVGTHRMRPQTGIHQFRVTLSTAGTYIMTARQNGQTSSIKMVCNGGGDGNRIEYTGNGGDALQTSATQPKNSPKYTTTRPFNFGDQMEYVGYATINGTEAESQRIMQAQGASQTFTLQFTQTQHYLPTVTTIAVSNITSSCATAGGTVTSDGGAVVTARGVCWSTSQNPTVSGNHTTDGIGTGSFTSSITGLTPNTPYLVRAYATNNMGTAYGDPVSFTTTGQTGQPCPGATTMTDIDGNTYYTVQIGYQCWMKENLRTTHYANGTSIALGSSPSTTTAYRYYPENNSAYVSYFGYLYNWKAVMGSSSSSSANPSGVQGICPTGWHVPSDAEWTQLTNYVGSQMQYRCNNSSVNIAKALASTTGWSSSTTTCAVGNNPGTNNATGFSALPAGYYSYNGYGSFGGYAFFWSTTEHDYYYAYSRYLYYNDADVGRYNIYKYSGFSVRCLRD